MFVPVSKGVTNLMHRDSKLKLNKMVKKKLTSQTAECEIKQNEIVLILYIW